MEKPLNRAEKRKRETRQRLLTVATKLLLEQGYANLTIRAITEKADVGYGTFYLHFADKDAIAWEIIEAIIEQTDHAFQTRISTFDSPQREYEVVKLLFQFVAGNKESFLTVIGRNGSPALSARYRDAVAKLNFKNLEQNRYLRTDIDVPNDFAANFISGATLRLAAWWLENDLDYSPEQMAQMMFEMIYHEKPPIDT